MLNVHPSRVADLRTGRGSRRAGDTDGNVISTASEIAASVLGAERAAAFEQLDLYLRFRRSRSRQPLPAKFPSGFAARSAALPVQQPLLRGRPLRDDRSGIIRRAAPGWSRVQAVCDWVHDKVSFGYQHARPTRTALDVFTERFGVCRDFQHLAVTLCRALNIPARYATGYLGDIGVTAAPSPMDFSAWFEAYLEDRWWTFDARHNHPRIGRVLMAAGRDASDVAITTSFGMANLTHFAVVTEEIPGADISSAVPLASQAGQ